MTQREREELYRNLTASWNFEQPKKEMKLKPKSSDLDRVYMAWSAGSCYFPPKALAKIVKMKGYKDSSLPGRVARNYYKESPLFFDLCRIFNVGSNPNPTHKWKTQSLRKSVYDKWLNKKAAQGKTARKFPILVPQAAQPHYTQIDSPYTKLYQTQEAIPQYYIYHAVFSDFPDYTKQKLKTLPQALREQIIVKVVDYLGEAYTADGTRIFLEGSSAAHLEKVMEKNNIKRIRCCSSGALIIKSDAFPVILVNENGVEQKKEAYVSRRIAATVTRVGRYNNTMKAVELPDDNPPRIINPKILSDMIDAQANGKTYKLAITQLNHSNFAISNLNEITTSFVRLHRGTYRLSPIATLMNYTTDPGKSKVFRTDHLHRCGFEVEVSTPYTVENAPRIGGKLVDPNEFFRATGWAPTFDRSVDPGFELKSPVISFDTPKDIRDAIPQEVRNLIDFCTKGDNCGGHIHYSHREFTPDYLYKFHQRWGWLFALIYPQRISNEYCEMTNGTPRKGSEHYRWLRLREGRIEVRVFPAFKKATALAWRAGLLSKMAMTQPSNIKSTIKSWVNDDHQIATHVFAVRSQQELLANLNSQKVQAQLAMGLGVTHEEMTDIKSALTATESIE